MIFAYILVQSKVYVDHKVAKVPNNAEAQSRYAKRVRCIWILSYSPDLAKDRIN